MRTLRHRPKAPKLYAHLMDLAHVMSHLGDQMHTRADYLVSMGVTAALPSVVAFPGVHSYHLKEPVDRCPTTLWFTFP